MSEGRLVFVVVLALLLLLGFALLYLSSPPRSSVPAGGPAGAEAAAPPGAGGGGGGSSPSRVEGAGGGGGGGGLCGGVLLGRVAGGRCLENPAAEVLRLLAPVEPGAPGVKRYLEWLRTALTEDNGGDRRGWYRDRWYPVYVFDNRYWDRAPWLHEPPAAGSRVYMARIPMAYGSEIVLTLYNTSRGWHMIVHQRIANTPLMYATMLEPVCQVLEIPEVVEGARKACKAETHEEFVKIFRGNVFFWQLKPVSGLVLWRIQYPDTGATLNGSKLYITLLLEEITLYWDEGPRESWYWTAIAGPAMSLAHWLAYGPAEREAYRAVLDLARSVVRHETRVSLRLQYPFPPFWLKSLGEGACAGYTGAAAVLAGNGWGAAAAAAYVVSPRMANGPGIPDHMVALLVYPSGSGLGEGRLRLHRDINMDGVEDTADVIVDVAGLPLSELEKRIKWVTLYKRDSGFVATGTDGDFERPPRQTSHAYAYYILFNGYHRYREMLPWFMKPQWLGRLEEAGVVNFTWLVESFGKKYMMDVASQARDVEASWVTLGATWRETLERGVEPATRPVNLTEAVLQVAHILAYCQRIPFHEPLSPEPLGAPAVLEELNVTWASLVPEYVSDPLLIPSVRAMWERLRPPDVYRATITLDTLVWRPYRPERGVTVRLLEGVRGRVHVDELNVTIELLYRILIGPPAPGMRKVVEALANITYGDGRRPWINLPIDGALGPDGACISVAKKAKVCLNVTLRLPPPPKLNRTVYIPFQPHKGYAAVPGADGVVVGSSGWWAEEGLLHVDFLVYGVPPANYTVTLLEGGANATIGYSTQLLPVWIDVYDPPARLRIEPLNLTICIGCPLPKR